MRSLILTVLMVLPMVLTLWVPGPSLGSGQADLAFQGGIEVFGSGSDTYSHGDVLTISVKIANIGVTEAQNVTVQMFIDGEVNKVQTIRTLSNSSDDVRTVIFTWVAIKGVHRVAVQLDPDSTIPESSENNNLVAITITVLDESIDQVVTESSSNFVLSLIVLAAIGGVVLFIGAAIVVGVILLVYFVNKK